MHAVTALAAVTFTCQDLAASVRFYRALGVDVRENKHGGPIGEAAHWVCMIGGVQLALASAEGERPRQSGTHLGLMVSNLEGALAAVADVGGTVVSMPQARPWGITALVEDPDGRRIELVNTMSEATGPMPF